MNKSKVIRLSWAEGLVNWGVSVNGQNLEVAKCFRCLGVIMARNRTTEAEVNHRESEEAKVLKALRNAWKDRALSGRVKMGIFESIVVP